MLTAQETKKYATFRYDTIEVENRLRSSAIFSKYSAKKVKYSAKSENKKTQTLRVTKFSNSNKIVCIKIIYFACDLRMDMSA